MLNTAMCSHGNRLFRLDTVEAKGITPLITPTGIRDHLDAVARQPMPQGAAANSVPQLHPQREIGVKSKVGRYAPKLRQPPQIVAWSFPYSFKTLVLYVKVGKMVETILRKGVIKGNSLSGIWSEEGIKGISQDLSKRACSTRPARKTSFRSMRLVLFSIIA